jgi:streptogramin lyase
MTFRSSLLTRSAIVFAAIAPFALLTGCGMGTQAPVVTQPAVVGGVLHGGQSPIQGSTVTLYETDSTATTYGAAGIKIGTGTSDINGNFTISPAVSTSNCTAGNMSYMVASGGYPSGQATLANTGTLMMIALGDCANLSSASRVVINELTTVAAAYSLSGFMTTSSGVANVSAPAANSALTGTVSAAAGMPHAFLNAATLVNSQGSINPYTISSSAGVTINGTIPGSLINTLADILQSCINGATGNTSCTSLYGFTPSITGVAPTNTLQSMINLARNPYPSAAAMTQASGLFSLISASPAFQPVLTSQPPDYSIAIVYKGTPLVGPYDIALDANDTVYAGLSGSTNVVGLSTYGVTVPAFTAGTGSATRQIAADSLGNIWVTNDASLVLGYNTSTGGAAANTITLATSGNATFGVAVDANSNLWIANDDAITGNLIEYKYTAATTVPVAAATYTANYTSTAAGSFLPTEITIDNSQNIWVAAYYTGGTYADVLPNLSAASTSATPTYTSSGTTITPISATVWHYRFQHGDNHRYRRSVAHANRFSDHGSCSSATGRECDSGCEGFSDSRHRRRRHHLSARQPGYRVSRNPCVLHRRRQGQHQSGSFSSVRIPRLLHCRRQYLRYWLHRVSGCCVQPSSDRDR